MNTDSVNNSVRPWVRYWARMIDSFLLGILLFLLFAVFVPTFAQALSRESEGPYMLLLFFLTIFVEALFLSLWGTTPRKWLLKTKVRSSTNDKLNYRNALKRSFGVWLKGSGIGIPFVALFTMILSYQKLKKEGVTSWDKTGGFIVIHNKIGLIRTAVLVILLTTILYLIFLGS